MKELWQGQEQGQWQGQEQGQWQGQEQGQRQRQEQGQWQGKEQEQLKGKNRDAARARTETGQERQRKEQLLTLHSSDLNPVAALASFYFSCAETAD